MSNSGVANRFQVFGSPRHQRASGLPQERSRQVESPSKDTFFNEDAPDDTDTCPYGCCERETVSDFVIKRGFYEGACSDITIKAFGKEYNFHKLILDRSGYFSSLFNGPWNEPSKSTFDLVFDHDENITQEAFELAIGRLYGIVKHQAEQANTLSMIAIGQYLDIPDVVCTATDNIVNGLDFSNVAKYTSFALQNNYGKASERILDSARGLLCSDGWQIGAKAWDGIPNAVSSSVVTLDSFFVPSEWERAVFIIKLLERQHKQGIDTDPESEIDLLYESLNSGVHYCHLTPEQLHKLENWTDKAGNPYIEPSVLRDALWLSIQLQKKVATADGKNHELGVATTSDSPPDNKTSWFIPTKDETLYGTPGELEKQVSTHHQITDDITTGKTTENSNDQALYKITKIPPFRFSVAFTGVSDLDSEKRVYAKTLRYAGSYWNLYVQKIKHSKGYQMGVYIHRATSSAPSKSGLLNRDIFNSPTNEDFSDYDVDSLQKGLRDISLHANKYEPRSDSSYSMASEGDPEASEDEEEDDVSFASQDGNEDDSFLKYEDSRSKISIYYLIYTPSRKVKTSLTCFISKPDLFNKSQSWGWKSNSMCQFNEDGTLADGQDKILKFMVILGNT